MTIISGNGSIYSLFKRFNSDRGRWEIDFVQFNSQKRAFIVHTYIYLVPGKVVSAVLWIVITPVSSRNKIYDIQKSSLSTAAEKGQWKPRISLSSFRCAHYYYYYDRQSRKVSNFRMKFTGIATIYVFSVYCRTFLVVFGFIIRNAVTNSSEIPICLRFDFSKQYAFILIFALRFGIFVSF